MKKVMFVCKQNSCRSQMAEAWAKTLGGNTVSVTSSGLAQSEVNPGAIAAMDEVGIDIRPQTSKPLSDFQAQDYDIVISLCGCGVNLPPQWVTREVFADWELEDPAGKSAEVFRRVREEIRVKVADLLEDISKS